jgi:hypothetical protein
MWRKTSFCGCVDAVFSQKYFTCWWNRPNDTTSTTWTDKLDIAANCLTVHFQTCWLWLPYLCRWDTTWKAHYMTAGLDWDWVTHSVLRQDHETRQIFTHTAFFALCTETQPRQGLWNHLGHTEPVFDQFCNSSEHLAVDKVINLQGQGYLQAVCSREKKTFQHQNLQSVWRMKVYIWSRVYLHKELGPPPPLMTWLQHTPIVRHLTCREEGLDHKIFMNNFFSWPGLSDD